MNTRVIFLLLNLCKVVALCSVFRYSSDMSSFIRARSDEQKEARLLEIKNATEELFNELAYQQITLTVIAQKLNWSRANLYKYVETKEEIFLEIVSDKLNACYGALCAAFPDGNRFSLETVAEIYAGILCAHQDYLRYTAYLTSIIECNVTVERLAVFKQKYYNHAYNLSARLAAMLGISKDDAYRAQVDVLFYASSYVTSCYKNPLIQKALELINITPPAQDLYADIKDFILMKFLWLTKPST